VQIVEHCIYGIDPHIDEEGIFRMSGSAQTIRRLKTLFNSADPKLNLRDAEWDGEWHALAVCDRHDKAVCSP
jgi:hypothetical protein